MGQRKGDFELGSHQHAARNDPNSATKVALFTTPFHSLFLSKYLSLTKTSWRHRQIEEEEKMQLEHVRLDLCER